MEARPAARPVASRPRAELRAGIVPSDVTATVLSAATTTAVHPATATAPTAAMAKVPVVPLARAIVPSSAMARVGRLVTVVDRSAVTARAPGVPRATAIGPSAATTMAVLRVTVTGRSAAIPADPVVPRGTVTVRFGVTMTPVPRVTVTVRSGGTVTVRFGVTMTPVRRVTATVRSGATARVRVVRLAMAIFRRIGMARAVPLARSAGVLSATGSVRTVVTVGDPVVRRETARPAVVPGAMARHAGSAGETVVPPATVGPVPAHPGVSTAKTLAPPGRPRIVGSADRRSPKRSRPGICPALRATN